MTNRGACTKVTHARYHLLSLVDPAMSDQAYRDFLDAEAILDKSRRLLRGAVLKRSNPWGVADSARTEQE